MRWYLNRETDFVCMAFEGSSVEVSDQTGTLESLSFDTPNEAYAAMRERCKPLFSSGYKSSVHPDDRFQPDSEVHAWWLESFDEELLATNGAQKIGTRGLLEKLQKDHNAQFSPDLRRFLELRDTHSFGWTNYHEWRIWDEDLNPQNSEVSNRFEQLILRDQNNYLGTSMAEAFFGGVFIGTAGNGDSYYAIPGADPNRSEVVIWDHENAEVEKVIADSVSSFAYVNHVLGMANDEGTDTAVLEAAIERIAPHVNPSWHYSPIFEGRDISPEYKSDSRVTYMYWRLIWVNYLLRQDGVRDISSMRDFFTDQIHAPLSFQEALEYPYVHDTPVTQFYWLWRLFWFDQNEDLRKMIAFGKAAPSPLVRDCALLIEELEDGRKTLGKIEDIHALRRQFLALDLDPARAEDRLRKGFDSEKRSTFELAAKLDAAHAVIATEDTDAVIQAAFDNIHEPEILEVLYEFLENARPDVREGLELLDFLGFNEDQSETSEIRERLASIGGMVPLLIQHKLWTEVGMSKHPRAVEFLLDALTGQETDFNHFESILRGLSAGEFTEHSREILSRLRPLALELRWGDEAILRAIIDTIGFYAQNTEDLSELEYLVEEGPEETMAHAQDVVFAASARTK